MRQAVFAQACEERQWGQPSAFLKAYAAVAERLGEPQKVASWQFHRWRQPDPPCPRPSSQRVLQEMFGMPLEQLGFTVPPHRRRPATTSPAASGTSRMAGLPQRPGQNSTLRQPAPPAKESPGPLRFAVLGPVRVWRGKRMLPPGQPQEHAVLCALLLRQGKTATRDELVDAVWGNTHRLARSPHCARTPSACARRSAPACWFLMPVVTRSAYHPERWTSANARHWRQARSAPEQKATCPAPRTSCAGRRAYGAVSRSPGSPDPTRTPSAAALHSGAWPFWKPALNSTWSWACTQRWSRSSPRCARKTLCGNDPVPC